MRVVARLEPHEQLLLAQRQIRQVPARVQFGELPVQRRIGRLAPERLRDLDRLVAIARLHQALGELEPKARLARR